MTTIENKKIVFYDGDCGLCNKSVQFVLKNEKSADVNFTALQSDFAKQFFIQHNFPEADFCTFYFWSGNQLFQKSSGALKLAKELKFPWNLLQVFIIVPKFIRDYVYEFIAKRRQKISPGFCAMPTIDQKERFLK